MKTFVNISNNETISINSIPMLDYANFSQIATSLLAISNYHCVNYYAFRYYGKLILVSCIADDYTSEIFIGMTEVNHEKVYQSMSLQIPALQIFEREISENFGLQFEGHPWLKPVRFPHNSQSSIPKMNDYPFFSIEGEELHEVGVGPIHAGIIEPGHFRFICKGEQILHLEIQHGYQHRGVEELFLVKKDTLQKTILAESIAGDTAIGHASAFINLWESLCGYQPDRNLNIVRTIALELERIAVHTGDLSAVCADVGFQLGEAVFGRLRTPIVNFMQSWCGNRLGKGLIRAGGINYPFTLELGESLRNILSTYKKDFEEMVEELLHNPGCLSRFEKTGVLSLGQAESIGAVGMTARASGLLRDTRASHPFAWYSGLGHKPALKHHGDVYSRVQIRREDIRQSMIYLLKMINEIALTDNTEPKIESGFNPNPYSFTLSLTEGWRGEICHCAVTGQSGELIHYKIKDPSLHNWLALALAVRKNEISDFPICNKSFNLSYCGFDL
jgi:Ni,Fe-hydrogenase III large subunit/NADH:ubiquinone oxidoreductase subunit C